VRNDRAETADTLESGLLFARAVHFPLSIRTHRLARAVLEVAHALSRNDRVSADALTRILLRTPPINEVSAGGAGGVAPTLRAQALASVLMDLHENEWIVQVDEGQVYVIAPTWHAGGTGLSPEDIRAEKERARRSVAARVREELARPKTQEFILDMERAHYTPHGPRSILNLVAEGRALADSLEREGAAAIKPYLQVADSAAGHDDHTGLRLWDVFDYFHRLWSFPFGSPPGRSVPFLIRDAGQPNHPVCGLVSLVSPIPRLTPRDSAFGWTAAWLEAIVAALDAPDEAVNTHFRRLEEQLATLPEDLLTARQVFSDLSDLLGVEAASSAAELSAALTRLGRAAAGRMKRARERIAQDLTAEVRDAFRAISLVGLGVTPAEALARPRAARRKLIERAEAARVRWHSSRALHNVDGPRGERLDGAAHASAKELRARARAPLFEKKRAAQGAKLLGAWIELRELEREGTSDLLRSLVLGAPEPWSSSSGKLSGGADVSRAVRVALLQRQTRFLASEIVDVAVCGAVPPYGALLGGKLAALLALSRDAAGAYHERYADLATEIGSQMAGKSMTRPADLLALITTSFYGVGCSQYARLRLAGDAGEVRWRFAGYSRGHGTMHFSQETSTRLHELVRLETGRGLNTSTFGEGPSERMRKVRDGLARLGLNADALVRHGLPRQVFVAELAPNATRPGHRGTHRPWRLVGPSQDEVAAFWRERWLAPRLAREDTLVALREFRAELLLLSKRVTDTAPTSWEE
jgi:hypothetical protein